MTRRATTFRIDEVAQEGLALLGRLSGRSANQLVNEAIKEFVAKRSLEIENELQETLSDLRAYRKRDPGFERAIADLAEAEASAAHDPAEGEVVKKSEALRVRLHGLLDG
jgi:predicted transcriptional regulator